MKGKMLTGGLALLCVLLLASTVGAESECGENHVFGPWKTKRETTCRLEGLDFRYCRNCDHWEKRYIDKLPHDVEAWIVTKEPTCTAKGTREGTCSACGDLIRRSIDMLPHEYGELEVVTEPTCTQNGQGSYTCEVCGKHKNEKIEKLGHDWGEVAVMQEPTCDKAGKGEQTCVRCGKTKNVKLDHLEHVYGEYTVKSEPQGKKMGVRTAVCTLCGREVTEKFYDEGTLYEGMTPCEAVMRMQTMLKDLGYYNGSIRTGTFGEGTGRAVARFQKANGLEETGVADANTLTMIESQWEKVDKTLQ